jgi:hypothetical protein
VTELLLCFNVRLLKGMHHHLVSETAPVPLCHLVTAFAPLETNCRSNYETSAVIVTIFVEFKMPE